MKLGRRMGQGMLRSQCRKVRSRPWWVYLISWCLSVRRPFFLSMQPFIDQHAQNKLDLGSIIIERC